MKDKYSRYCTGCGLCERLGYARLVKDSKGFYIPVDYQRNRLDNICPFLGPSTEKLGKDEIWGSHKAVFLGWSNDLKIRKRASSGGVITQIAVYLLENHLVDFIIQIGVNSEDPTTTEVFYSTTPEEVLQRSGSRYSISSPLKIINDIDYSKRYAFIGKPCDVLALKNYMQICPQLKGTILYILSFFCMGVPSELAQEQLLKTLGCENCKALTYRGDGWPGYTTAVDVNGAEHKMDYDSSWGKILGRDLMNACKYCIDGIGELSDISCGDAWYLNEDNTPDFSEHDGRNVVFARSQIGLDLLADMKSKGLLSLAEYSNYDKELPLIQMSQYNRRIELLSRIIATKVMMKQIPNYRYSLLNFYARSLPFTKKIKVFLGSVKRICRGKL